MLKTKDLKDQKLNEVNIWDVDNIIDEYRPYAVIEFLENCLKTYEHYLVFAFNCTWNGASGYTFEDDLLECIVRDYDVSQFVQAISKHNKSMLIKEFHHDKPFGHNTIIIGLTDKEYETLVNKDFSEIEKFANKYLDTLLTLSA
jgi:hypothetical protein